MNSITIQAILGSGVFGLIIYAVRKSIIEYISHRFEIVKNKEIELIRTDLQKEIEHLRHKFQLEQDRSSKNFEALRASYKEALDIVMELERLVRNWEPPEETEEEIIALVTKLGKATESNSLFYDEDVYFVMRLCYFSSRQLYEFMGPDGPQGPSYETWKRVEAELNFLAKHLSKLLRLKIGIETGLTDEILYDLALYGGAVILSNIHFQNLSLPTKEAYGRKNHDSIYVMVHEARENKSKLIEEVKSLVGYLDRYKHGQLFFEYKDLGEKVLRHLA